LIVQVKAKEEIKAPVIKPEEAPAAHFIAFDAPEAPEE